MGDDVVTPGRAAAPVAPAARQPRVGSAARPMTTGRPGSYTAGMRPGLAAIAVGLALACRATPAPRPAPPWQVVSPTGAPVALYAYGEVIGDYAPEDRGAYVVQLAGAPETRRAAAARLGAGDDLHGDDGYVVRLTAAEVATWRGRAEVHAVGPLQPVDRRGALVDRGSELPEVRIELFADATADEVEALAAWITWRGGAVAWRGRTAVRAQLPQEARDEASRLSIVRWIE